MDIKSKALVAIYVLAALLALLFTWYHVPAYLGNGIVEANRLFWEDALFKTSPSGKFIAVDVLFLAFVCSVYMYIEGRRLGIKYLHAYVVAGILIAISVAFPLFLAARELSQAKGTAPQYAIKYLDGIALLVLFLAALGAGVSVL